MLLENRPINTWWGPPQNFSDRKAERKISWLELFYDLVYVAAIGRITHHLAAHLTWHELAISFLLFALIFWSWVNGSQYYDLHGSDGLRTRFFTLLQVLAIAAVAITLDDAFKGNHIAFAVTFSAVEILITYLWFSVGFFDPSHRVFNKFYTFNYSIALLLLIISCFLAYDTAMILWIIALVLNLTPSLIGARTVVTVLRQRGQVFSASNTIVERFGLFTIIVLAESLLSIVNGVSEIKEKHPVAWIAFIAGILITFLLWSIYFDMTSEQETKKGYSYLQWLIFLHFPLLAALGAVGACISALLTDLSANLTVQWIFCISVAVILFCVTGLTFIMKEEEEDRSYIRPVSRLLVIIGLVILAVPLFGHYLDTLAFLCAVALILSIPVFIGIKSWVRWKLNLG